jgi:hypothetical protein
MWMEETIGERVNVNRTREAVETGADQIAVGCPFCRVMLSDGLTEEQSAGRAREEVEVLDVAQLLLASVKGESPVAKASSPRNAGIAAEPSAKDATQTESTVTETADAGPAAKASGGGSLFDTPAAPEAKPAEAKPAAGGSLFDTPAPAETTPAEEKPGSSGSLFDVAPAEQAEAPKTEAPKPVTTEATDSGGSLFDFPSPGQDAPTPSEEAQAEAVAEEKPATSEPEAASSSGPTAAEAKEAGTAPAPGTEIGSGSLFDIPAPAAAEGAPAEETAAEPVESEDEDAAPEAADEPADEAPAPASSGEAHQPATDKKIPEGGSLFDI